MWPTGVLQRGQRESGFQKLRDSVLGRMEWSLTRVLPMGPKDRVRTDHGFNHVEVSGDLGKSHWVELFC